MKAPPIWLLPLALLAATGDQSLSPGTIGLLIQPAGERDPAGALARALADPSAANRSAAARVINVTDAKGLLSAVREALKSEADLNAAREEMRALASLGTSEDNDAILDAAKRLGYPMGQIASGILAKARGAEALPLYFARLRQFDFPGSALASFFCVACRHKPEALDGALATALQAGDTAAALAILEAASEIQHLPPTKLLALALGDRSRETRHQMAWKLVKILTGQAPSSPDALRKAVDEASSKDADAQEDPDDRFGLEILSRLLGRKPGENKAWLARLEASKSSYIDAIALAGWIPPSLTSAERKAVDQRMARLYPGTPPVDTRPPKKKASAEFQYPGGLPAGFAAALLSATGCVTQGVPEMVWARVGHDDMGRPKEVTLESPPADQRCALAATLIVKASLDTDCDCADRDPTDKVLLIMDADLISLLEAPDVVGAPTFSVADTATPITPPVRTHFAAPEYPPRFRELGREGKVVMSILIDTKGIPRDMRIIRSAAPDFSTAAIGAVALWRYKPALRETTPVAVTMTLTIEFKMP